MGQGSVVPTPHAGHRIRPGRRSAPGPSGCSHHAQAAGEIGLSGRSSSKRRETSRRPEPKPAGSRPGGSAGTDRRLTFPALRPPRAILSRLPPSPSCSPAPCWSPPARCPAGRGQCGWPRSREPPGSSVSWRRSRLAAAAAQLQWLALGLLGLGGSEAALFGAAALAWLAARAVLPAPGHRRGDRGGGLVARSRRRTTGGCGGRAGSGRRLRALGAAPPEPRAGWRGLPPDRVRHVGATGHARVPRAGHLRVPGRQLPAWATSS